MAFHFFGMLPLGTSLGETGVSEQKSEEQINKTEGLHGKDSDGVPWKIIDSTPTPEVK